MTVSCTDCKLRKFDTPNQEFATTGYSDSNHTEGQSAGLCTRTIATHSRAKF